MTNSTRLLWPVLAPLFVIGCDGVEHSKQQWRMVITDASHHLLVVTTSPDELFRIIPSYHTRMMDGTVSDYCDTGWLDPNSGRLATLERDGDLEREGTGIVAIRVYDRSMKLLAEHRRRTPHPYASYSCPLLSPDGNRLVWIDHDQNVLLGRIQEDHTMLCRVVCQIPEGRFHFTEGGTLAWLGDQIVVAGGNVGELHMIHLETGERKLVDPDVRFIGMVGTELGINAVDGVFLMSTEGERTRKLGVSLAGAYHDYAGHGITRLSPDGRYLAYDRPVAQGLAGGALTIQDLSTNRRVSLKGLGAPYSTTLQLRGPISMGSWTD